MLSFQTLNLSAQSTRFKAGNIAGLNFSEPESQDKKWNEETYYRWASFSDETPLENMLKLKIPIYVISGGKDF